MVSLLLSKGTECNKVDLEIPHQCATVIAHGRYYGRNIGCYNGRNISAIFPCNGQSANTVFSAETVIFSQNKPVTALFSCNGQSAKTGFWPKKSFSAKKKPVSAEISYFWPDICNGRYNGFGRKLAFKGSPLRQKISVGRTLSLIHSGRKIFTRAAPTKSSSLSPESQLMCFVFRVGKKCT